MELIISIIALFVAPVALIAIFVVAILYQLFVTILIQEKRNNPVKNKPYVARRTGK